MKLSNYVPRLPSLVEKEVQLNSLLGQLSIMKADGETYHPATVGVNQLLNDWIYASSAYRQQTLLDLLVMARSVEEIRGPINHIVSEVFRKGIQWKPKFALKCLKCGFEHQDSVEKCTECESTDLTKPDEHQKDRLNEFLKDCNIFDQSLEEVLMEAHFSVNALDTAYIYIPKEYKTFPNPESKNKENAITVRSKPLEIRNLPTPFVEVELDEKKLPKNKSFVCYIHREEPLTTPGKCQVEGCGLELVPVMYNYYHYGKKVPLLDSEVIRIAKFSPSETYGFSPILSIVEKVLTIMGMDKFLYRYFWERSMPSSLIMVFTDDPENLKRERAHIMAETRKDPHYIPMVAVSARNQRGRVDMVRLFHTLQEMDYLPVRQEIRERISAMWGVTPVWQGSPEAFGGLSTTTPQLTVMSRVIEGDQRIYHDKVFPWILESFGVTDWLLHLPQPEEKAEATRISFAQQKISAASALFSMGFDVTVKSQKVGIMDIDFIISGEAKRPEMGGLGGLGGQPGGGGLADLFGPGGPQQEQPQEGKEEEEPTQQKPTEPNLQLMQKAQSWAQQIIEKGHLTPEIHEVVPSGDNMFLKFNSQGTPFVAKFVGGNLIEIQKAQANLHAHGNYPPHLKDMKHDTMTRQQPGENKVFDPEEPDEI